MVEIIFSLVAGLLLLIASGNFLVKHAVLLAKEMHISPLVIGLTIVAFGTSAPELIICIQAALSDHPDIVIGNILIESKTILKAKQPPPLIKARSLS